MKEQIDNDVIGSLEKKIADAEIVLKSLELELKTEKERIACEKFGVKVGTIVRDSGIEYRVTEVDVSWQNKPWLKGNPRKKDGTFGTAVRHLYGRWELAI